MDYYNSASARKIVEILHLLEKTINKGNEVKVIWKYFEEDDEMLEKGVEYNEMSKIPFKFESFSDED